jgi:L-lactate dehydrogenase (cytochrome)
MTGLSDCHSFADFERAARRRLPRPLLDYIAGGADDESTLRRNTEAFDRYILAPRYATGVDTIDLTMRVLGCDLKWPLILAPTGMNRMFHPDGELAVAEEAARHGIGFTLSTMATTSIEEIAAAASGPKIFQLYLMADEAMNFDMIDRCKAAGYDAICITIDTIAAGNRERDLRSGLTVPPRLQMASLVSFLAHPGWCLRYLTGGNFSLPNVAVGESGDISTLAAFFAEKMEKNITWDAISRVAKHWNGPFAIKGIQCAEDALKAADSGATAVIISNHGGRQLDGADATINLLADIVDQVDGKLEIIADGGFRRGSHIIKALAMGATACMTGRPYLYGLSSFGRPGVARVLNLLYGEVCRTMALIGCESLTDLDRSFIRRADIWPEFLTGHANTNLSLSQTRTLQSVNDSRPQS